MNAGTLFTTKYRGHGRRARPPGECPDRRANWGQARRNFAYCGSPRVIASGDFGGRLRFAPKAHLRFKCCLSGAGRRMHTD